MNRGPVGGKATKDHVEKAHASWGDNVPEWVVVLAEQCNKSSQTAVGRELSYSGTTISLIISNSYGGPLDRVREMVSGRFMSQTVNCPVGGEIGRDACLNWQKKPYSPTSSFRVQMYRACRDRCQHSKLKSNHFPANESSGEPS